MAKRCRRGVGKSVFYFKRREHVPNKRVRINTYVEKLSPEARKKAEETRKLKTEQSVKQFKDIINN